MSIDTPDGQWEHLFPEFRNRLHGLFAEAAGQGLLLHMVEGFRSQDRQSWLYGQGRPGEAYYHPGPIVTDQRITKWHGAGLAADCYPIRGGSVSFDFTASELHIFRSAMPKFGLRPTAFPGDYGHTQLDTGEATRQRALAWVRAGFHDPHPAVMPVAVLVNGKEVVSAGAYMDAAGQAVGWLRPIADALGAEIAAVAGTVATLAHSGAEQSIPGQLEGGRLFVPLMELQRLPGVRGQWDSAAHRFLLTDTPPATSA